MSKKVSVRVCVGAMCYDHNYTIPMENPVMVTRVLPKYKRKCERGYKLVTLVVDQSDTFENIDGFKYAIVDLHL